MALTQVTSGILADSTQTYGMKNRIINGDMRIDQRNNGAALTVNSGNPTYGLDRFYGQAGGGGVFTMQRSTVVPNGFTNSLLATVTTADSSIAAGDLYLISQSIEGFNTADLGFGTAGASTVTLSFWVRSSIAGTFSGTLVNHAFNRSYPFTYTINSANTWEYETITIPGDTSGTWFTDNSSGLRVYFSLGAGSSYSGNAGSWIGGGTTNATGATNLIATVGATFYITGVQLEKGTAATAFDYRPYGTELQLCQRYYYVLAATGGNNKTVGSAFYANNTRVDCVVTFKVSMRTSPSFIQTTGTDYYAIYASNAQDNFNGFNAAGEISTEGCNMYTTSNVSGTQGAGGVVYTINSNANIAYSAEL